MDLPKFSRFRFGRNESRIYLDDFHLIGVLKHPNQDDRVEVTFHGPTGQCFSMPTAEDVNGGTSQIITAALHYDYRPHELAIAYFIPNGMGLRGYGIWCPTCQVAGTPLPVYYDTRGEAGERCLNDHEMLSGQPAFLVTKPRPLSNDLAPPTAWPIEDHDRA